MTTHNHSAHCLSLEKRKRNKTVPTERGRRERAFAEYSAAPKAPFYCPSAQVPKCREHRSYPTCRLRHTGELAAHWNSLITRSYVQGRARNPAVKRTGKPFILRCYPVKQQSGEIPTTIPRVNGFVVFNGRFSLKISHTFDPTWLLRGVASPDPVLTTVYVCTLNP